MKLEYVYKVGMEWDYEQRTVVFASEELAWEWVRKTGVVEDAEETLESLVKSGLVWVNCIPVIYSVV